MIPELTSLITSSKAAYDIAKGISALKSEVKRNESISKILEVLVSVQTNALNVNTMAQELQDEKRTLSQKLMDLKNWSQTERQYELKEIASGLFVYVYKNVNNPSKPIHWLCAKCFNDKKAHIIQIEYDSAAGKHYFCPNCLTKYFIQSYCSQDYANS